MRKLIFRAIATAAAAACLVLAAPAGPAAAADPALAVSGMRVTTGHVEFYLSARDLPAGADFGAAHLAVTVDGTPLTSHQTTVGTDSTAPSRAVVLVVDVSGSMKGARLAGAKAAAQAYLDEVPADVKVGVIAVSTAPSQVLAPTTNHRAVANAVNGLKSGGKTALYDSIAAANAMLVKSPAEDQRILLLSDGGDSSSSASLQDATSAAVAAGVPVDTVGFQTNAADESVLTGLATATSGHPYTAADDASLASAFQAAAGWFGTQLDVTVDVPAALSGQDTRLTVVATMGSVVVQTATPVRFAIDPSVAVPQVTAPKATNAATAYLVIGGVIFAAMLLIGLVVFAPLIDYTRHRRRVAQIDQYAARVAAGAEDSGRSLTEAALAATEQMIRSRGAEGAMADKLDRAGMRLRPHEWVLLRVTLTVVSLLLFGFLGGIVIGLLMAVLLGILGPWIYQRLRISSRRNKFAAGLPDALQLVVGSLRSGFSLSQAFSAMAKEMSEPMSTEFGRALAESRLGVELEDALSRVAQRMGSSDLTWVVVAIRVQREIGGNLAEVLTRTVETMRDREAIRGQVNALAAEGKLSAYILVALPLIISAYMFLVRPDYIRPLYAEPLGLAMLLIGAVLLTVGALWMAWAVKVEV